MFGILYREKYISIILLLLAVLCISSCSNLAEVENDRNTAYEITSQKVPVYSYRIVNIYPHDRDASTQGLVFEDGVMYEGTGIWGKSSLRKVELETGHVLQLNKLSSKYFGEGVTVFQDIIVQLTWKSNLGFVYDRRSFKLLRDFAYATEGWGITNNGKRFIMSDGTSTLYFLEPETFSVTGHIEVYDNDIPINNLNGQYSHNQSG